MSNFNIGDKVKSKSGYIGTVVAVYSAMGVVDIVRGDGVTGTGVDDSWCTLEGNLTLIEPAADEELPRVPKSVLHQELSAYGHPHHLRVQRKSSVLTLSIGEAYVGGGGCIMLEPDAVLQLCHDLRRMAMKIKREQKQEMMKNEDI